MSNPEQDDEQEPSEFNAFEQLTKDLLTVKKADLDEARGKPA